VGRRNSRPQEYSRKIYPQSRKNGEVLVVLEIDISPSTRCISNPEKDAFCVIKRSRPPYRITLAPFGKLSNDIEESRPHENQISNWDSNWPLKMSNTEQRPYVPAKKVPTDFPVCSSLFRPVRKKLIVSLIAHR